MLQPVWHACILAILGVFIFHVGEVRSQCWESNKCTDLSSEDGILECIKACKMDLSAESPVFPGNGHIQPLSENIRKYVMSHFRWNKFGRRNSTSNDNNNNNGGYKREDIANYPILNLFLGSDNQNTQEGIMEDDALDRQDSKRSYSMEHFRWGKPVGKKRRPIKVFPTDAEEESSESFPIELRRELSLEFDYPDTNSEEELDNGELLEGPVKKGRKYKMHHFRWEGPPKDKRYGGFMTPERSQTPLMTLFKNAIIKNAHKKGQ
uniref:Pro-opiomelanocortin n=1 Tax=Aquarana catesbeiana TaxID=8400 RepID=COLI_AQUCT|nr:RecName: Full=Pro-opiomelanocortin; Short=POMC; AltName: Full=Corticotropin-lipotropin; Contains: RecName: Full=NPP; Contains: RecName: Full=Melanotropin gamma; AltName: Full=Gamma-MSH; Contains: RecName: Full=Corticotropin; AltName: Full=Adrenocorticotropic hormone; Short=ACTH; Contains: RecName: Full=Melanocyte-stimulating hormone alpha; Short=Alpha-MSH; AltName: Full=Melanotropin alpha; Contains: RecName: Full=Corticotropin-like intermediary peptide; Short=CLIP; Contains: RecName: Full=Lipotr